MAGTAELLECPFCAYSSHDSYMLMLHVEERHTDDSPFVVREGPDAAHAHTGHGSSSTNGHRGAPSDHVAAKDSSWVLCPDPECGEHIPLGDLDEHLDLHFAERLLESPGASVPAEHRTASSHSSSSKSSSKKLSTMRHGSPSIASEHSFSTAADDSFDSSACAPDEERRHRHHRSGKHDHRHHHQNGYDNSTVTTRPRSDSEKTSLSRSIIDVLTPSSSKKHHKGKETGPRSARLGKKELGPYAYEDEMPAWLYKQLQAGPKVSVINRIGRDGRLIKQEVVDNETPGVLPVLAQLCAIDRGVDQAYLCHPSTIHIFRRPSEGGFCGYRNIQMMVSYIQGAKAQGHSQFPPGTPGILVLQALIEQAWDMGINDISRIQTGGIKGTRKYIGTPEAQALLRSLRIDHGLQVFSDRPEAGQAHEQLLDYVETYFAGGTTQEQREKRLKVMKTYLPPIYLQQPGHSITIVGYERHRDGKRNLLVFDPMYHTSPGMSKLLGRRDLRTHRPEVLHAYRRGERQLKKHRDYELISLKAHPPLFPAWDVLKLYGDHPYVYVFFLVPSLGYNIIPEDKFPNVFPWWHYGALFCIDDARFAWQPPMISYYDEHDRFDVERIGHQTDTGLLGGMLPLQDSSGYIAWMGLFDWIRRSTARFNKEAREKVNASLKSVQLEGHIDLLSQELPLEDVYFEKSVGPAVPIHYACGAPLRQGYQHYAFKRCGPSSYPSFPESSSSGPSILTPASSTSPEFPQPLQQLPQQPWQYRGVGPSMGNLSNSSYRNQYAPGCLLHHHQLPQVDGISPRTSLPDTTTSSSVYSANHPAAFHNRHDSCIGMLELGMTFLNLFPQATKLQNAPIAAPQIDAYLTDTSPPRRPSIPLSNSTNDYKNGGFGAALRPVVHLLSYHRYRPTIKTPPPPSPPPKSPAVPPILDLGSVDLISFPPLPPTIEEETSSSSMSSLSLPPPVRRDSGGRTDGGAAAFQQIFDNNQRPPTPVHELRDFFYERSAETGESTPVFYSTGGNDVSRGWRAKMGAEW